MEDDGTTIKDELAPGAIIGAESISEGSGASPPSDLSPDEVFQAEREGRIRSETEARVLRETRSAQAQPPPASKPLTREEISTLFARGDCTDDQRVELLADLKFNENYARKEQERREQDSIEDAQTRFGGYLADYPDLGNPESDLVKKVGKKLRELVSRFPKMDTDDLRDQVLAIEHVVGERQSGGPRVPGSQTDLKEFQRKKIPTGGGPSGASGGGSDQPAKKLKEEVIWGCIVPEAQTAMLSYHKGNKAEVLKDLSYATPETIRGMQMNGRFHTIPSADIFS